MDVSKLVNHGGGDGDGDDNGGEPSEQRGTAAASPLLESIVLRAVEMQQQTLRAQVREASKGWTGPILTSGGGAQMRAEAEARRATIETRDLAVQQNAAFQQAQEKRTKDSHVNTRLTMLLALFAVIATWLLAPVRPSDLLSGLFTGRSPAGALGVLGSLLGWLGEQMPGILVGIGVTFILTRLAGSQAGYLGRALWRVRWLVRGEALCPHCLGRGLLGEPILGDLGHNTCFTCLNEVTRGRVHAQGYVRLTTLMQGWDWVHWQQRVSYYTVPTPPREKRKAG